jgi:membrane protein implicated in regulation of membrane protease activity
MSDFFKDASKLSWWVGVVVVGLVLNVVASYIRNWMDRTGSFVTERRHRRSVRYREEVIRQADRIRGDPYSILAQLIRSIRVRLHGLYALGMGCLVVPICMRSAGPWAQVALVVAAIFFVLFAMLFDRLAERIEDVALEAGVRRSTPAGDKTPQPSQDTGQPAT